MMKTLSKISVTKTINDVVFAVLAFFIVAKGKQCIKRSFLAITIKNGTLKTRVSNLLSNQCGLSETC